MIMVVCTPSVSILEAWLKASAAFLVISAVLFVPEVYRPADCISNFLSNHYNIAPDIGYPLGTLDSYLQHLMLPIASALVDMVPFAVSFLLFFLVLRHSCVHLHLRIITICISVAFYVLLDLLYRRFFWVGILDVLYPTWESRVYPSGRFGPIAARLIAGGINIGLWTLIFFWLALLIAIAPTFVRNRAVFFYDSSRHRCCKCGYALIGISATRCPECGTPIPPGQAVPSEDIRSRGVS